MNLETATIPQIEKKTSSQENIAREFLGAYEHFDDPEEIIQEAITYGAHHKELLDPRGRESKEREIIVEYNKYNKKSGKMFYINGDKKDVVTRGDMYTGHLWDQNFYLDPAKTPDAEIEKYLEYRENQIIKDYIDKEIASEEVEYNEHRDLLKHKAYSEILKRKDSGSEQSGIIAEKFIQSFLEKLSIDTGVDFEIQQANTYQDVEYKMDFVVSRKSNKRGVQVETGEIEEKNGIQFTLNREKTGFKKEQVAKANKKLEEESNINQVILVVLDSDNIMRNYKQWKLLHNKGPGGPDRYLSHDPKKQQELKKQIVTQLLYGILEPSEIKQIHEKHIPESSRFDHTMN